MAQKIAEIDSIDSRWGSDELIGVMYDSESVSKKAQWLIDNCPCDPEETDITIISDDLIDQNREYMIYYGDWSMCEVLYVVKL